MNEDESEDLGNIFLTSESVKDIGNDLKVMVPREKLRFDTRVLALYTLGSFGKSRATVWQNLQLTF